jgi:hypothetical protein
MKVIKKRSVSRAHGFVSPEEAEQAIRSLETKKQCAEAVVEEDLAAGLAELAASDSVAGHRSQDASDMSAGLQALRTQLCNRYVEILDARIQALRVLARTAV